MLPLPLGLPSPDPDALLTTLAGCVGANDLWLIARANHGWRADENVAALNQPPVANVKLLGGDLREVLNRSCWDQPSHRPECEWRHWRRAFACAALMRAAGEPENHALLFGENASLAGLIDSLGALGGMPLARAKRELVAGLAAPAAANVAWLIPRLPRDDVGETALFGLGLLWFSLALAVPDGALVALAEWIMATEDEASCWRRDFDALAPSCWLIDATCYGTHRELWRAIGQGLPGRLLDRHGPAAVEAVELIAATIADGPRA